jgi:hypothetical protein
MSSLDYISFATTTPAVAVSTGSLITCAQFTNNKIRCWGYGGEGSLGYGNSNHLGLNGVLGDIKLASFLELTDTSPIVELASTDRATCVMTGSMGTTRCWGGGGNGVLGQDSAVNLGLNPGDISTISPVDLRPAFGLSGDAALVSLVDSEGAVVGFCPERTVYNSPTPFMLHPSKSVVASLTATCSNPACQVAVLPGTAQAGAITATNIAVPSGTTITISIKVTAQNGVTTRTYTVAVRKASANCLFSAITDSAGIVSGFSPSVTTYGAPLLVPSTTLTVASVSATAANPLASVSVAGSAFALASASAAAVPLLGPGVLTSIPVVVRAEDGFTTCTTTLKIRRQSSICTLDGLLDLPTQAALAFATGTTLYSLTVPYTTSQVVSIQANATSALGTIAIAGGSAVAGSTATAGPVSLAVGANSLAIVVTAEEVTSTMTYTVAITRGAPSTVSTLSALSDSAGIVTGFAAGTTTYGAPLIVLNAVTSIATISATTTSPLASCKVQALGYTAGSCAAASVPLANGLNAITVTVLAQDGVTSTVYTLKITRVSNDANLLSLTDSLGIVSSFSAATTAYGAPLVVAAPVSVLTSVSAICVSPACSVRINAQAPATGSTSASSIALPSGQTTIVTVTVTAEDGATVKSYTLSVYRTSSDATLLSLTDSVSCVSGFAAGTTQYPAVPPFAVSTGTSTVSVSAMTANAAATCKVNAAAATAGSCSLAGIALPLGSTTTVTVTVTAQDATTTVTYSIVLRRASSVATLSSLTDSLGCVASFAPATTLYSLTVPSATANLASVAGTCTASPLCTVQINALAATSGSASASNIALSPGANSVTVKVVADDLVTTITYTLSITRLSPSISTLSALSDSAGCVSSFASGTTTYGPVVVSSVTSAIATISATASDPLATVKINALAAATGSSSAAAVPLSLGVNTYTVTVTSQDSSTTTVYSCSITRPSPTVSTLSALTDTVSVVTSFAPATTSYTRASAVGSGVSSFGITATASDPAATVSINGGAFGASPRSAPVVPIALGVNTVLVACKSGDASVTTTYTLVLTRPPPSSANLTSLTDSAGATAGYTPGITVYPLSGSYFVVPAATATLASLSATLQDPSATLVSVAAAGPFTGSGTASAVPLAPGDQTLTVVHRSADFGTVITTSIKIRRSIPTATTLRSLADSLGVVTGFTMSTTAYGSPFLVPFATSSVASITAVCAEPACTVSVAGRPFVTGPTVTETAVALAVGPNAVTVSVRSPDLSATTTFTLSITRSSALASDASLSSLTDSLSVASPFAPTTLSYAKLSGVSAAAASISVTATTSGSMSTVQIGWPSGSAAVNTQSLVVPLTMGLNTISIRVVSQDTIGVSTYVLSVYRPSAVATLSALSDSLGAVTGFAPATTSYPTVRTVASGISSDTVTATCASPQCSMSLSVAGTQVALGSGSVSAAPVPLAEGLNPIAVRVTSEDNSTTVTYTFNVKRLGSSTALLSLVDSLGVVASSGFSPSASLYSLNVPGNASTIDISAACAQAGCTVVGAVGTGIPVPASATTDFVLAVLPEDPGAPNRTVTLRVTRPAAPPPPTPAPTLPPPPSTNSQLAVLSVSSGPGGSVPLPLVFNASNLNYAVTVNSDALPLFVTAVCASPACLIRAAGGPDALSFAPQSGTGSILSGQVSGFATASDTITLTVVPAALTPITVYTVTVNVVWTTPMPGSTTATTTTTTTTTTSPTGGTVVSVGPAPVVSACVPGAGYPGAVFTVVGANFGLVADTLSGPADSLFCASVRCISVVWINSTALLCVTPSTIPSGVPATSSGPCVVTTLPGPQVSSPGGSFTFLVRSGVASGSLSPLVSYLYPSSGPSTGGTEVTITGSRLGKSAGDLVSIEIAGFSCSQSKRWVSSTRVTCVTAPGRGSGPAVVTTALGGPSPVPGAPLFSYTYPPAVIASASPRVIDPSATNGQLVTIHGENFGDSAAANPIGYIGGRPCRATTWVSSTEILCLPPLSPDGQPSAPGEKISLTVTVNGRPGLVNTAYAFAYGIPCNPVCFERQECIAGQCNACLPGWTGDDCVLRSVEVLPPAPGPASRTSEDGGRALIVLRYRVTQPPTSTVTYSLVVSASQEARVDPTTVSFSFSNYQTPQTVTVTGLADSIRDGPVSYSVSAVVDARSPPIFALAEPLPPVNLLNLDSKPRILRFKPAVVPFAGGVVTLFGLNFDHVCNMSVRAPGGGAAVPPARLLFNSTDIGRLAFGDEPRNASSDAADVALVPAGEDALVFKAEAAASGGYAEVRVINADGSFSVVSDQLFYTEDCPGRENMYGVGSQCFKCPEGGVCPGGNRIWPKPGYWNTGETSGFVSACSPPEACLGGRDPAAACARGYVGPFCGTCTKDYYRSTENLCVPCPKRGSILVFIVADCILWCAFATAAVVIRDRFSFSYIVLFVKSLQLLSGVGSMMSAGSPAMVVRVFDVLHLFSGDYSIIKPDCINPVPYFKTFFVSIAYSVAIFLPTFIGLVIARSCAAKEARWYWSSRTVRVMIIWCCFVYLPLTSKALEVLSCYPAGKTGTYFMLNQPSVSCYNGSPGMLMATVASALILLLLTIFFPIKMLLFLRKRRASGKLHDSESFKEKFNYLYEFYNPNHTSFWVIEFPISIIVAAGKSILRPHVNYQMTVSVVVFGIKLVYIMAFRPFIDGLTNLIQGFLAVVSLVLININFFARHGLFEKVPSLRAGMGYLFIGLLGALALGILGAVVSMFVTKKDRDHTELEGEGGEDGTREEDEEEGVASARASGVTPRGSAPRATSSTAPGSARGLDGTENGSTAGAVPAAASPDQVDVQEEPQGFFSTTATQVSEAVTSFFSKIFSPRDPQGPVEEEAAVEGDQVPVPGPVLVGQAEN